MQISEEKVIDILNEKRRIDDILLSIGGKKKDKKKIRKILSKLESDGKIERIRIKKQDYYQLKDVQGSRWTIKRGFIYVLLIITIFTVIYYIQVFSQFKQIPACLYGCDLYFHYGIINHICNGNPPWTNPQFLGEYAHYPWITHLIVATISKVTSIDPLTVDIYFPLLIFMSGSIIAYLLGKRLFTDDKFAIMLCIGWMGSRPIAETHPHMLSAFVLIPLFLWGILYAIQTRSLGSRIIAGVMYGLTGIGHGIAVMSASLIIAFLFIYYTLLRHLHITFSSHEEKLKLSIDRNDKIVKSFKENVAFFVPILLVGIPIALLYWGFPIFVYHGHTPNPWHEYGFMELSKAGGEYALNFIMNTFFNFSALINGNIYSFIFYLFFMGGLYHVLTKKDENTRFILILTITATLSVLHFLVTVPLLNMSMVPHYFISMMMNPVKYLLFVSCVFMIYTKIKNQSYKDILLVLTYIFLFMGFVTTVNNYSESKWANVGKELPPTTKALFEMADWVKENTDKNAVFISNNECSFALNGLTGRKLVTMRRTHSSMYVDMNERQADAAVILYGNDTGMALKLLEKYNVSYLYWDFQWLFVAYHFNEKGEVVDISDPLMTSATKEHEEYFRKHGVNFRRMDTWVDPAHRGPKYKTYDMLIAFPSQLDPQQPWSEGLSEHLELAKEFKSDGLVVARISRIRY